MDSDKHWFIHYFAIIGSIKCRNEQKTFSYAKKMNYELRFKLLLPVSIGLFQTSKGYSRQEKLA